MTAPDPLHCIHDFGSKNWFVTTDRLGRDTRHSASLDSSPMIDQAPTAARQHPAQSNRNTDQNRSDNPRPAQALPQTEQQGKQQTSCGPQSGHLGGNAELDQKVSRFPARYEPKTAQTFAQG